MSFQSIFLELKVKWYPVVVIARMIAEFIINVHSQRTFVLVKVALYGTKFHSIYLVIAYDAFSTVSFAEATAVLC